MRKQRATNWRPFIEPGGGAASNDRDTGSATRVALVEDDQKARRSLAVLIGGAEGFKCVGAYANGEEALHKVAHDRPQVVLMDINLPGMSGIDCAGGVKEKLPDTQVVMLTAYEDDDLIFNALRAGATGYLLKRTPHALILAAITDVRAGGSPMNASIARRVVQHFRQPAKSGRASQKGLRQLSPRENEILAHLAEGSRYKEISQALGIQLETVRTHLRRIYEKLQVSSRTEAVVRFLR
jgi:DNA-binding NarL/FixJ family response regulator